MSTPPSTPAQRSETPSSILIIGGGIFGLTTALALSTRSAFARTKITLVDRSVFPAPDASSIDNSRLVRTHYAKISYAKLARDALEGWRGDWGKEGRYHEGGLCVAGGGGSGMENGEPKQAMGVKYVRKTLENEISQ